jgi:hypothetical protein
MAYTSEQQTEHYRFLLLSIEELKSGRKPTDDWEQEHFNFFSKIRMTFPDFRKVSENIQDKMFRVKMNDAEQLARYIELYWESNGDIPYDAYLQFLQRMKYAVEYEKTDDEIADLMSGLSM